ncbi:uncharacterized protein [Henckelia pumila]|uniref:uncharacterized protein n=1 Tax=Henckelia pumila TaxID=405737 RepID=UPI003C6E234A
MGRVGDNEPQNNTASQAQETISDSFPENAPPPPISQAPSNINKPQSNRPHGEGDQEEDDLYPIDDHHQDPIRPVSFPPQNINEYGIPNQPFPPANMHFMPPTAPSQHAFPPANMHFPQPTPPPPPQHAFSPASMYIFPQPTHPSSQHGVQVVYPVAAPLAQQPLYVSGVPPAQVLQDKPWNSGLFDCMNDPENALITFCCPCITFGQIAEILDYGSTSCATSGTLYSLIAFCFAIPCIISCSYRTKLRAKFGLVESPAPDWVVHCCCEWCALCQEYRQLKDMGYDPSIGWAGNEARMRRQLVMTPPMGQMMTM